MVDVERLFFVPQYPTRMRYQEWWYWKVPQGFSEYFDEVVVVSPMIEEDKRADNWMFSPIDETIEFEAMQIKEYLKQDIKDNDFVFFADISFAGIVPQITYLKRNGKKFGFAHATSLNRYDYFAPVRAGKWLQEQGIIRIFDKIFVASRYHKFKLLNKLGSKYHNKIQVVGLPKPPFRTYKEKKEYDVLFASRRTKQKFSEHIWEMLKDYGLDMRIKLHNTWEEYYKGLSRAKVVLMMSKEETYGYQVVEAVMNNSVVVAPNRFSFPELLPREYLYDDSKEAVRRVLYYVEHWNKVPRIKRDHWEMMKNWYKNVSEIMKSV